MSVLRPRLTKLDQRVLDAVPKGWPGVRAARIIHTVRLRAPAHGEQDIREVLRGLESVGLVQQRGGWWTQC